MTFSLGNALILQMVAHETLQNEAATLESIYQNLIPIDTHYTTYEVLDYTLGQLLWMGLIQQVPNGFSTTKLGMNYHLETKSFDLYSKEALSMIWHRMNISFPRQAKRHNFILDAKVCRAAYLRATKKRFVHQDALILTAIFFEMFHHEKATLRGIHATVDGINRSKIEASLMEQGLGKLIGVNLISQVSKGFITTKKGNTLLKRVEQIPPQNKSLSTRLLNVLQARFKFPIVSAAFNWDRQAYKQNFQSQFC